MHTTKPARPACCTPATAATTAHRLSAWSPVTGRREFRVPAPTHLDAVLRLERKGFTEIQTVVEEPTRKPGCTHQRIWHEGRPEQRTVWTTSAEHDWQDRATSSAEVLSVCRRCGATA